MINDPVEQLLTRIERPVQPRPEFTAALLQRLLDELETKSAPVIRRPAHARAPSRFLKEVALVAALLSFVAALVFGVYQLRAVKEAVLATTSPAQLVATIIVGNDPVPVAIGDESIWVGNQQDHTISRVDPNTNRVVATIRLPGAPWQMAAGAGALWVTDAVARTVYRIDPATNQVVKTIHLDGGAYGVAVGEGAVWVGGSDGIGTTESLSRIDPTTGQVIATIPGLGDSEEVAVGAGAVWLTNGLGGQVFRVDPGTNRIVATIAVARCAGEAVFSASALWVATCPSDDFSSQFVSRIDPASDRVAAVIPLGRPHLATGSNFIHIAAGQGAIWVLDARDDSLVRLDPRTNRLAGEAPQIKVGLAGLAVNQASIWVSRYVNGTLLRLHWR